jgi:hypothetical protein
MTGSEDAVVGVIVAKARVPPVEQLSSVGAVAPVARADQVARVAQVAQGTTISRSRADPS